MYRTRSAPLASIAWEKPYSSCHVHGLTFRCSNTGSSLFGSRVRRTLQRSGVRERYAIAKRHGRSSWCVSIPVKDGIPLLTRDAVTDPRAASSTGEAKERRHGCESSLQEPQVPSALDSFLGCSSGGMR